MAWRRSRRRRGEKRRIDPRDLAPLGGVGGGFVGLPHDPGLGGAGHGVLNGLGSPFGVDAIDSVHQPFLFFLIAVEKSQLFGDTGDQSEQHHPAFFIIIPPLENVS